MVFTRLTAFLLEAVLQGTNHLFGFLMFSAKFTLNISFGLLLSKLSTQTHKNVKLGSAADVLLSLRWSIAFIVVLFTIIYTISLFKKKGKPH